MEDGDITHALRVYYTDPMDYSRRWWIVVPTLAWPALPDAFKVFKPAIANALNWALQKVYDFFSRKFDLLYQAFLNAPEVQSNVSLLWKALLQWTHSEGLVKWWHEKLIKLLPMLHMPWSDALSRRMHEVSSHGLWKWLSKWRPIVEAYANSIMNGDLELAGRLKAQLFFEIWQLSLSWLAIAEHHFWSRRPENRVGAPPNDQRPLQSNVKELPMPPLLTGGTALPFREQRMPHSPQQEEILVTDDIDESEQKAALKLAQEFAQAEPKPLVVEVARQARKPQYTKRF